MTPDPFTIAVRGESAIVHLAQQITTDARFAVEANLEDAWKNNRIELCQALQLMYEGVVSDWRATRGLRNTLWGDAIHPFTTKERGAWMLAHIMLGEDIPKRPPEKPLDKEELK